MKNKNHKIYISGLYRAAVMESGTALLQLSMVSSPRYYAFQLGQLIQPDFKSNCSKELLKVLLSATADEIQAASLKVRP